MAIETKTRAQAASKGAKPPYHRSQILLEVTQFAALKAMSEREGRSISELVREMVQAGLEEWEAEVRKHSAVMDELATLCAKTESKSGVYRGEDQVERVLRESEENLARVQQGLESCLSER